MRVADEQAVAFVHMPSQSGAAAMPGGTTHRVEVEWLTWAVP